MKTNFFVPHIYGVSDFGSEDFTFGVGIKSSFGAGTDWAQDSFARYVSTKTVLESASLLFSGAYDVNDQWSFGAGVDITESKLSESKALNQQTTTDAQSQIKGNDTAWGYNLSTLYKLNDRHQFGLVYKSAIELEYEGEVHLDGLSSATLLAVFGGSQFSTRAEGNLELPQSVALGYSFRPDDQWILNFDVQWMDWSSIEQQNFEFPNASVLQQSVLNPSADLPLDWESTVSYGIGAEYAYTDDFRVRFGYTYNPSPIPDANFHTFLPDANSHNFSVGFGWNLAANVVLDTAYMALVFEDRTVSNNVGASVGGNIDGEYEEYVHFASLTLTYTF